VRRALSRVGSGALADELLAIYFLKCRLELLSEWLDLVGLAHEDGILQDEVIEAPDAATLEKHVATFRAGADGDDRELLLQTFSAQTAIDWPALEAAVSLAEGNCCPAEIRKGLPHLGAVTGLGRRVLLPGLEVVVIGQELLDAVR